MFSNYFKKFVFKDSREISYETTKKTTEFLTRQRIRNFLSSCSMNKIMAMNNLKGITSISEFKDSTIIYHPLNIVSKINNKYVINCNFIVDFFLEKSLLIRIINKM